MLTLTLYAKQGCHLCDDARDTVEAVLADYVGRVELREVDIEEDPALMRSYGEEIPVVMIGERRHSQWFVDETKLRDRLERALAG